MAWWVRQEFRVRVERFRLVQCATLSQAGKSRRRHRRTTTSRLALLISRVLGSGTGKGTGAAISAAVVKVLFIIKGELVTVG
jgi:uncharacterized membrane protein (DUF4010 family)